MPDGPILGNGDLGVSVWADPGAGSLVVYIGLNQMWGTSKNCSCPELQPACCTKSHADFYDVVFPRRLAVGGLTIQSNALRGANFSASLHLETAHVTANLSRATDAGGASLGASLFLAEDENILLMQLTPNGSLGRLNISTWVEPLSPVCQRDLHKGIMLCEQLDGAVRAGCASGVPGGPGGAVDGGGGGGGGAAAVH
eukprot:COSAG01_NODE_15727_length_1303_cov_0.961889_1_plen_197_part_10